MTSSTDKNFSLAFVFRNPIRGPSGFYLLTHKAMAATHTDKEIAENIGTCSMGELAGAFHYFREKSPNLYAILACHPGLSESQRETAIVNRGEQIKQNLFNVDWNSLNVCVGVNGHSRKHIPEDFISIRDSVAKRLGITIDQAS